MSEVREWLELNNFRALADYYNLGHLIKGLTLEEARRVVIHFDTCPTCGAKGYTCQLSEIVDPDVEGCSMCEYCETIQYPLEARP